MSLKSRLTSLVTRKTGSEELSIRDVSTPDAPRGLGQSVSLKALKAKGTATEWYEAIAIGQGLCRWLIETGNYAEPALLQMSDVFLDENGRIAAVPNDPGTAAEMNAHIGRIISQLIPEHDFMFLRDRLVAKATATPPVYQTLDELSQALEYYERPNRDELIRGVYQRWAHGDAPVVPAPQPAAEPPKQPVVPEVPAPDAAWSASKGERTRYLVAAAAAIVLLAGLGAVSMWIGRTPKPVVSTEAANTQLELPTVDPVAPVLEPVRVVTPRPARTTKSVVDAAPVVAPRAETVEPPPPVPTPAPPRASEAPVVLPPLPVSVENRQIHRATDPDVAPPRLLYPQRLAPVGAQTSRNDFMTFEVVIDDRGLVESVKAKDSPHTIGELLILLNALSTAKSWRFDPALKDDAPVRYSQLVALPLR